MALISCSRPCEAQSSSQPTPHVAAETMNSYIGVEQNKRVYYRGARFVRGRDEYLPIPNAQYNFSEGNYVQNPGYGKFN